MGVYQGLLVFFPQKLYEINVFKLRWVFSVFLFGPWLRTKLKSHVILYWVKCFVIGEDGDLVWRDKFVSFKQQYAKALSELERQHNSLLDDS